MGSRVTVFARAAWAVRRGLRARTRTWCWRSSTGSSSWTPLWLGDTPRVTLIHHIHRDHDVTELGRVGPGPRRWRWRRQPLKLLYSGGSPFLTISEAAKADITALGIPAEDVHVGYLGVVRVRRGAAPAVGDAAAAVSRAPKKYKRIELLLDAVEAIPEAVLDIAGEGDHRPELEAEIARRGLGDRVVLHGHVTEAVQGAAVRAGVGEPDGEFGRGVVPDGHGGRDVRDAQRGAARRRARGIDRGR